MDEKDKRIQLLTQDVARWKNRAVEAVDKACFNCEEYAGRNEKKCSGCRMEKIKQEAGK